LVVVVDELHRSAEQAAPLVHVVLPDLHGQQRRLAVGGESAGQRHAEADLDRVGAPGDEYATAREHERADRGPDQGPVEKPPRPIPFHRFPLSARVSRGAPVALGGESSPRIWETDGKRNHESVEGHGELQ